MERKLTLNKCAEYIGGYRRFCFGGFFPCRGVLRGQAGGVSARMDATNVGSENDTRGILTFVSSETGKGPGRTTRNKGQFSPI